MPLGVRAWFVWAFALLVFTGLFLGRIVEFIDFSEGAPFSLLGIFMMVELAVLLFSITVALQRKRIAQRFAVFIALIGVPVFAGLPPILLDLPQQASNGWWGVVGAGSAVAAIALVVALLRPAVRAWFSEP